MADDPQIVAEGLRSILEPDFALVGIAADERALLEVAKILQLDVIVADISMPLLNGIEATRYLRTADAGAKIIVLTMRLEADLIECRIVRSHLASLTTVPCNATPAMTAPAWHSYSLSLTTSFFL